MIKHGMKRKFIPLYRFRTLQGIYKVTIILAADM